LVYYLYMNNAKGFGLIGFIITLVIVVGVVGSIVYVLKNNESGVEIIDGWKTYKNEKFGFTFQYPPEYFNEIEDEDENGIHLVGDQDATGVERMLVSYYKPSGEGLTKIEGMYQIISWFGGLNKDHLISETNNPETYHFYKEKFFVDEDIFVFDDKTENGVMFAIERTINSEFPVQKIVNTLQFSK